MEKFENMTLEVIENILKELPSNIFLKDKECRYVFATHYWRHLNVEGQDWDIKGKTDLEIRKDKENAIKALESDRNIIKTKKGITYTIKIEQDGKTEYLEIIKNPVFDKNKEVIGIVGLINDVTERVNLEIQLQEIANKDQLTGLYNRSYLEYWNNNYNNKQIYPVSIIVGDCNKLKYINDTYGHVTGDEYIKKSAKVISKILPKKSVIARLGGDEFIAIIPNTDELEVKKYIDKMKELAKTIKIKDRRLSLALGATTVKKYVKSISKETKKADDKMYIDKELMHKEME